MIPIYLRGEITQDSVTDMMDRLSAVDYDTITIYITCYGGDWNATQVLINYIETWFKSVDIIISGYCMSAAWRFALLLKNVDTITVLQGAYASDHTTAMNTGLIYSHQTSPENHHETSSKIFKKDCDWWMELCKQEFGYTAKELKQLKAGSNVYFDKERMDSILKSSTFHRKS